MLFNLNRGVFTNRSYEYSGQTDFRRSGSDYMFALLTSAASGSVFRLLKSIANADLCLVAGGQPGYEGYLGLQTDGDGGNGGEIVNVTGVYLPAGDYTVIIGESGKNTVLVAPDGRTWTSRSGYGSSGGTGNGNPGDPGAFAWGDANTTLYPGWRLGAGGGHGYVYSNQYQEIGAAPGGSVGAASEATTNGHGGTNAHPIGYAGLTNVGQGAGGGARIWNGSYYDSYDGGAGGSGIILIRKHKEAT